MKTYKELNNYVNSLYDDDIEILKVIIDTIDVSNTMNNVVHKANGYTCPYCKSININKNGKKNGKQRYICKECGKYFIPISKSMFIKTHHKYINWLDFIHCELLGLSLEEESYECDISKTTAFYWRHKLYSYLAISSKPILSGVVQYDSTYLPINLKGTKQGKMPRKSKKRGNSDNIRGISHIKVCILTAIDENDNLFISIAGTGRQTTSKMKILEPHIKNCNLFICDGAHAVVTMAQKNNIPVQVVKAKTFTNENHYNLNEINQIHKEIHSDLRCRVGVSTRHLQGYLDMFCFKKILKYTTEYHDRNRKCLDNSIKSNIITTIKDIIIKAWPFDTNDMEF